MNTSNREVPFSGAISEENQQNGLLDQVPFPAKLTARVIAADASHVFGYNVAGDLIHHYSPSMMTYLALTGELPSMQAATYFDVATMIAAPLSIAHASTHTTVLTRICGATERATQATAALVLSEETRVMLDKYEDTLRWFADGMSDGPPKAALGQLGDDACENIRMVLLSRGCAWPFHHAILNREATFVLLFVVAGLKVRWQLEAAIVHARLPWAMAEAMAVKEPDPRSYPTQLPPFRYKP